MLVDDENEAFLSGSLQENTSNGRILNNVQGNISPTYLGLAFNAENKRLRKYGSKVKSWFFYPGSEKYWKQGREEVESTIFCQ